MIRVIPYIMPFISLLVGATGLCIFLSDSDQINAEKENEDYYRLFNASQKSKGVSARKVYKTLEEAGIKSSFLGD